MFSPKRSLSLIINAEFSDATKEHSSTIDMDSSASYEHDRSNFCTTILKTICTTFFTMMKFALIGIYRCVQFSPWSLPLYFLNEGLWNLTIICKKRYKTINISISTLNFLSFPIVLIFIFRKYFYHDIYSDKMGNTRHFQSWEYGLVIWWVTIAILNIISYLYPCLNKYNKIVEYEEWWKQVRKTRKKWKRKILIPFGINLQNVSNIETAGMDWHIILVCLFPALLIGFTLNFAFSETFELKCGNSDYYKNHTNSIPVGNNHCILVSSWSHWYIYYFSQAIANVISSWGLIKLVAMMIIKYAPGTCDCRRCWCTSSDSQYAGGRIEFINESDQIAELQHAIVLLYDNYKMHTQLQYNKKNNKHKNQNKNNFNNINCNNDIGNANIEIVNCNDCNNDDCISLDVRIDKIRQCITKRNTIDNSADSEESDT